MAERSKAAVLKTVEVRASWGSNPYLRATVNGATPFFFVFKTAGGRVHTSNAKLSYINHVKYLSIIYTTSTCESNRLRASFLGFDSVEPRPQQVAPGLPFATLSR